jgi:drug/metabolite transporter (DMT)-like permease
MKILPLAALVAVIFLWSNSFVAIRHALQFLSPAELTVLRFALALVPVVATLTICCRAEIARMSRYDWLVIFLLGLIAVPGYNFCLYYGEMHVSAGIASMIIALSPAFTYVIAILLRWEKANRLRLVGVPVALCGIAVSVFGTARGSPDSAVAGGTQSPFFGAFLVLAASVMWAIYNVLGKSVTMKHGALTVSCLNTAVGTIPLMFWLQCDTLTAASKMPPSGWISVIFLAVACTYVAIFLYFYALRAYGASKASVSVYFLPPMAVLGERLMLGEKLSLHLVAGMALLLAGVLLATLPGEGQRAPC